MLHLCRQTRCCNGVAVLCWFSATKVDRLPIMTCRAWMEQMRATGEVLARHRCTPVRGHTRDQLNKSHSLWVQVGVKGLGRAARGAWAGGSSLPGTEYEFSMHTCLAKHAVHMPGTAASCKYICHPPWHCTACAVRHHFQHASPYVLLVTGAGVQSKD
jgi:hypothetical protein